MTWTGATAPRAREHLRAARPGDVLVLYSERARRVLGVGTVASEPTTLDGHDVVDVRLEPRLARPIGVNQIRRATPGLGATAPHGRQVFTPLTARQWAPVRALLVHADPDLADRLPPATVPPDTGMTITHVGLDVVDGRPRLELRVENKGNVVWERGAPLGVSWTFRPDEGGEPLAGTISTRLGRAVAPGSSVTGGVVELPEETGRYAVRLTVEGPGWAEQKRPAAFDASLFRNELEIGLETSNASQRIQMGQPRSFADPGAFTIHVLDGLPQRALPGERLFPFLEVDIAVATSPGPGLQMASRIGPAGSDRGGWDVTYTPVDPFLVRGGASFFGVPPVEIPGSPGEYELEWGLALGNDAIWPPQEYSGGQRVEVVDPSDGPALVSTVDDESWTPDARQRLARAAFAAGIARDPETARRLLDERLVEPMVSGTRELKAGALEALYEAATSSNGRLEAVVRDALAARRSDLGRVRQLTKPAKIRSAESRAWLESVLASLEGDGERLPEPSAERPSRAEPAGEAAAEEPEPDESGSRLRDEPPPAVAQSPPTQVIWRNVRDEAERPLEDTHTLDVHITPAVETLRAEAEDRQRPERRSYSAVLTLAEEIRGRPAKRFFEGQVDVDIGNEPLGRRYGAALHRTLFNPSQPPNEQALVEGTPGQVSLEAGYQRALGRAEDDEGLRIQLRIADRAPELHAYRWEYLWDESGEGPLACGRRTPFSRVLHVARPGGDLPRITAQRPLRILACLASPDLASSADPLVNALAPIDASELHALGTGLAGRSAPIEPLEGDNVLASPAAASLAALVERLEAGEREGRPFHVLHLLCHGLVKEDGKTYVVLHAEESDSPEPVADTELAERLAQFAPTLRLVVLASCFTALPTQERPLQGVGRSLVAGGVPAVVAMQDALEFEAAQRFSQRLYAHLAGHGEIDRAVNAARKELFDRRKTSPGDDRPGRVGPSQWGIPVLFMRVPDGRLLDVSAGARRQVDPDAETKAVSYSDVPGADPAGLTERMLNAAAGHVSPQLGVSLDLTAAVAEVVRQSRLVPVAEAEAEAAAPSEHRLFEAPGLQASRDALERAARRHRIRAGRRAMLFLRGLARAEIQNVVSRQPLQALSRRTFGDVVWSSGSASCGDVVVTAAQLVEGGTDESRRIRWRAAHRSQTPHAVTTVGNLTWPDGPDPPRARLPLAEVDDLLYGDEDTFAVFARVATGGWLDESIASLLLHAVYPRRYVPYEPVLARAVLERLRLADDPRYGDGYRGFCRLAAELVGDDDLGFESLADVFYFFQGLASGSVTFDPDAERTRRRSELRAVDLDAGSVDSDLQIRQSVWDQSVAALNAGQHVILIGPPGTGKTTIAEDLCRHAGDGDHSRGHVMVTATADWTTFDTIGGYMPESGGRLTFRPGIFLEAIERQRWLVIDEINRSDIDKAFGELFTLLSGQAVTLPYADQGRAIRILPPGRATSQTSRDYAIHPSWRIIGTMNVYDKASLFAMSYAFMRRFAFVDVPIPAPDAFDGLLRDFLRRANLEEANGEVTRSLTALFDRRDGANCLMKHRALGPAIAKDVVRYLGQRAGRQAANLTLGHLAEAVAIYVAPQLDGLERQPILSVYAQLSRAFSDPGAQAERDALLGRIQELFPYIASWDAS